MSPFRMRPLVFIAALSSAREASATPLMPVAAPLSDENPETIFINEEEEHYHHRDLQLFTNDNEEEHSNSNRDLQSSRCNGNKKYLLIDLTTDDYGFEDEWRLLENTNDGVELLESGPPEDKNYGKRQRYVGGYCLSPGSYRFIITDLFKDGMCCSFGQGKYAGYVENNEVFSSPEDDENWERRGHTFTIDGPNNNNSNGNGNGNGLPFQSKSDLAARDLEWLESHNSRRSTWHNRYGKNYVPVRWSQELKEQSKTWAEKLARDCKLTHDTTTRHGENIALNYGWGTSSFSERRTTDSILTRFVENEADEDYPDNGHLTQVLWRATKYIGCADAVRPMDGGSCHAQVCRYSKPGNCDMSRYKSNNRDWWLEPMLSDSSPCGDEISG